MAGAAGWTTGSSNGCGGASSMRTFMCKTTAADWRRGAGWAVGLTATTRNGPTRAWVMRRRPPSIMIPAPTAPSRPDGKRCSRNLAGKLALYDSDAVGSKRLENRPPAAVEFGTLRKRRGRTGSARHASFSLFQRVLQHRANDSQTTLHMTAAGESRAYFRRSVV